MILQILKEIYKWSVRYNESFHSIPVLIGVATFLGFAILTIDKWKREISNKNMGKCVCKATVALRFS